MQGGREQRGRDHTEVARRSPPVGTACLRRLGLGNGLNTVSGSTVSNTELSEFFRSHRVAGRELSEFLSAYYLCEKANSPSLSQNSPSLPQNSVSSVFRNSTLETVFRPFPMDALRFQIARFYSDLLGVPPWSLLLSKNYRDFEASSLGIFGVPRDISPNLT